MLTPDILISMKLRCLSRKNLHKKYSHQSSPPSHLLHTGPGGLRGNTYRTPHFCYELLLCTALSSEVQPTPQAVYGPMTDDWGLSLPLPHQSCYNVGVGFLRFSSRHGKNQNTSHSNFLITQKEKVQRVGEFFLNRRTTYLKHIL